MHARGGGCAAAALIVLLILAPVLGARARHASTSAMSCDLLRPASLGSSILLLRLASVVAEFNGALVEALWHVTRRASLPCAVARVGVYD